MENKSQGIKILSYFMTKSLLHRLPTLPTGRQAQAGFTKGGIPLFGNFSPVIDRQRGVRGDFRRICLLNYGLLINSS
jgi:hypothetical protein